ncbi:hypothetical protein [Aeromonas veronii]|uniref:hypothetical protein n=1 Tax=Aeromonas veronii TaxID=654 RepID=UPI0032EEB336
MIPSLLLSATLLVATPAPNPVANEAASVCQQFVQVRLGKTAQPEEVKVQPVAKRVGEWLVDGKVKGPEGPLLFACLLKHQGSWELLNFSLWAPQELNSA